MSTAIVGMKRLPELTIAKESKLKALARPPMLKNRSYHRAINFGDVWQCWHSLTLKNGCSKKHA
jgi:hypothetical protein